MRFNCIQNEYHLKTHSESGTGSILPGDLSKSRAKTEPSFKDRVGLVDVEDDVDGDDDVDDDVDVRCRPGETKVIHRSKSKQVSKYGDVAEKEEGEGGGGRGRGV